MSDKFGSSLVEVDYQQYYLAPVKSRTDYLQELASLGTKNGVTTAGSEALMIHAGTESGAIRVEVKSLSSPPPLDLDTWDAAVEVNLDSSRTGGFRVTAGDGETLKKLPVMATPAGHYRLRVYVRGRDAAAEYGYADSDEVAEEHLLCVWPSPPQPDLVLKSDGVATELRAASSQESAAQQVVYDSFDPGPWTRVEPRRTSEEFRNL